MKIRPAGMTAERAFEIAMAVEAGRDRSAKEVDDDRILELHEHGHSEREITELLGCSRDRVRAARHRLGSEWTITKKTKE